MPESDQIRRIRIGDMRYRLGCILILAVLIGIAVEAHAQRASVTMEDVDGQPGDTVPSSGSACTGNGWSPAARVERTRGMVAHADRRHLGPAHRRRRLRSQRVRAGPGPPPAAAR